MTVQLYNKVTKAKQSVPMYTASVKQAILALKAAVKGVGKEKSKFCPIKRVIKQGLLTSHILSFLW